MALRWVVICRASCHSASARAGGGGWSPWSPWSVPRAACCVARGRSLQAAAGCLGATVPARRARLAASAAWRGRLLQAGWQALARCRRRAADTLPSLLWATQQSRLCPMCIDQEEGAPARTVDPVGLVLVGRHTGQGGRTPSRDPYCQLEKKRKKTTDALHCRGWLIATGWPRGGMATTVGAACSPSPLTLLYTPARPPFPKQRLPSPLLVNLSFRGVRKKDSPPRQRCSRHAGGGDK